MAATLTILSSPDRIRTMTVDNPTGGVVTGQLVQKQTMWGIAVTKSPNDDDVSAGATTVNRMIEDSTYALCYSAEDVQVPKDESTAIDQGDPAYFDPATDKFFKTTATGRVLLGFWKDSYLTAETTGLIDFEGRTPQLV